ncbi:hypothetical protein GALL_270340 [mine drainage metagenome]|uniref:Uncharacterized protein n=1 Tax=mine drainage metagenome TaxID=410659 RepID=A0A1J5RG35_9ZZZZ
MMDQTMPLDDACIAALGTAAAQASEILGNAEKVNEASHQRAAAAHDLTRRIDHLARDAQTSISGSANHMQIARTLYQQIEAVRGSLHP